jgi:pyruvate/2-oxoacid:ferredoxin oxidoreductase alpha subunit
LKPALFSGYGTIAPSVSRDQLGAEFYEHIRAPALTIVNRDVDKYRQRNKLAPSAPVRQTPLGDNRFEELVRQASAFFAAAERDEVAEKAVAIEDIRRRMIEYGLTVDDLVD